MSSQKGNCVRKRPQKHNNTYAFKNNLHDTSPRVKLINSVQVKNVCEHCKSVIEWKIKYKKYKPLTQMRSCVRCHQRNIRCAYHVICDNCLEKSKACAKCLQPLSDNSSAQNNIDFDDIDGILLKIPERKRRTLLRLKEKVDNEDQLKEYIEKLKRMSLEDDEDDFE